MILRIDNVFKSSYIQLRMRNEIDDLAERALGFFGDSNIVRIRSGVFTDLAEKGKLEKKKGNVQGFLYLDGSADSKAAKKLMRASGVRVEIVVAPRDFIPGTGFELPTLRTSGANYVGLERIKNHLQATKTS